MTRPVRVPNVSAGARSGLDHHVIGANAQAAYDENETLAAGQDPETPDEDSLPAIPEDKTTVDDLLGWVSSAEDDETAEARARAVLAAEQAKPADDRRSTLVEPLEASLASSEDPGEAETQGDGSGDGSGQPDAADSSSPKDGADDADSAGDTGRTGTPQA